jgi:type IV pilus assembly protein PilW
MTPSADRLPNPLRAERGLSLVELMVAMAIGLVITVVIANLFLGTKQSYRLQDDVSRIQENARFAAQVLERTVRLAGYRADWNQSYDQVFNTTLATPVAFAVGQVIAGANNTAVNASDTIAVRFQGSGAGTSAAGCAATNSCAGADSTVLDCLGNRIDRQMGAARFVTNILQVRSPGANGGPALFCSIDDGTTWVEIVPDIENMQILYGEKTSSLPSAERYLVAGAAGQNMGNVIAVRLSLLHRSPNTSAGALDTRTYNLAGTVYDPVDDFRVRMVSNATVGLRNRTQ